MAHVSLENQLKKLLADKNKVRKLKFEDGKTVEDVLKSQAELLIDIIKKEIDLAVYSKPEGWYKRSGDLRNSINENIFIDPQTNTITISFLEDKAWHDSWITKQKPDSGYDRPAYVPMAIIEGYEVFNSGHMIQGVDFIQNAIDRFDKEKKAWITVKVEDKEELMGAWWK